MIRRWLRHLLIVAVIAVSGCGDQSDTITDALDASANQSQTVQAVLISSSGAVWDSNAPLTLVFWILNGTDLGLSIDGRLIWPGTLELWVTLPSGRSIPATTQAVKMSQPTEHDMVRLPSDTIYGRRLVLSNTDHHLIPALRHPVPGEYELWAIYHTVGNEEAGCEALQLTTNRIRIIVK